MDIIVQPGRLCGTLPAVASKSHMHRLLLCAALCRGETTLIHGPLCEDIEATLRCIQSLGARVVRLPGQMVIQGRANPPEEPCLLPCGESGSTYRFLLPVAAALGVTAEFSLSGRLHERPIRHLAEQLCAHGVQFSGIGSRSVGMQGRMEGGHFVLPGNVSSQYITGMLLAMPCTGQECTLTIEGPLASAGYVDITLAVLARFGIRILRQGNRFLCPAGQAFHAPGELCVEGDWSNAAFALCAAAAARTDMRITGLCAQSEQGDKEVLALLRRFGAESVLQGDTAYVQGRRLQACMIDVGQIPDLVMALCLPAALSYGETTFTNAGRLRMKESDRIASTVSLLQALGAQAWTQEDQIHVRGSGGALLPGGIVDACNDHRIAMTAACAAAVCTGPVQIQGAECVAKSYPGFFDDIRKIGLRWESVQ